jgi:hypothetical protein
MTAGLLLAFGLAASGPVLAQDAERPARSQGELTETPRPSLEVREPRIDVGFVKQGEPARAVFELFNAGDAELKILKAKPS